MSSTSLPYYPQQRTNPMFFTGSFSTVVIALLVTTMIINAYRKPCVPKKDEKGEDVLISKKECCARTWERFSSSVPLTIFIVSLVICILALIFIYFGKSRT